MSHRLPDFLIIGAPKAGTTYLYHVLDRADGITMSSIKEPRFFTRAISHDAFLTNSIRDLESYCGLWSSANDEDLLGEASPIYLHDPETPAAVADLIPDVRLIVSLRDPVSRAISHYRYHELRTGRSTRTLEECLERSVDAPVSDYHRSYLLEPGFYARHLTRWLEHFQGERIHIVLFEELVAKPHEVVDSICHFLGVATPTSLEFGPRASNAAAVPRGQWAASIMQSPTLRRVIQTVGLQQAARHVAERTLTTTRDKSFQTELGVASEYLNEIYQPDVAKLSRLLGRSLPWDLTDGPDSPIDLQ